MHIFALGASRNIGYNASLRFLAKGDTVTFLLRSLATLENDEQMKPYIESGKATLVKGDATSFEDVSAAWKKASSQGTVDLVLFTVGGTQVSFSITKGAIMTPPNLCTEAILTTQRVIVQSGAPVPKFVVVSSTGLTRQSKAIMPILLRPLYGWLLHFAHEDKRGLEAVIHHGIGIPYEEGETPGEAILPAGWKESLPATGWAKHSVIIRAAWLTDGEATGKYRAAVGDFKTWTVARKDVAHFIAEELLVHWDRYLLFYGGSIIPSRLSVNSDRVCCVVTQNPNWDKREGPLWEWVVANTAVDVDKDQRFRSPDDQNGQDLKRD